MSDLPDVSRLPELIERLYAVVDELHEIFPQRAFTPDGHLVGDIGESIAAYLFNLTLNRPSTEGHDGTLPPAEGETKTGRPVTVEIKCTQRSSVSFYESEVKLDQVLVLRLARAVEPEVIYNGPAGEVLSLLRARPPTKNGQRSIQLQTLRRLNEGVREADRIPQIRRFDAGMWRSP